MLAFTVHPESLDRIVRRYREAPLAAGLVGHMSSTDAGTGVERAWGAMLRCGGSGQARLADSAGQLGVVRVIGDPARCRPADLELTLEASLQRAARAALGDRDGAVVVLDARSGALRAAYGRLGTSAEVGIPAPPLMLSLAPGSTFKLVVAAAALRGGIEPDAPFARGYRPPGGRWLRNAGDELCGGNLDSILASSCNSAFAALGRRLGFPALVRTAARFGFGRADVVSGMPTAASSVGAGGHGDVDLLTSSAIGQGRVTATPLQIAEVGATIADDGMEPEARLVAAACVGDHAVARTRPRARRVLTPRVAAALAEATRAAVERGTGRVLADLPGRWAAKTGTAEIPRLRRVGTPAGSAAWMVAFPTSGRARRLVIAALVLPSVPAPLRQGAVDAGGVIHRLAGALMRTPRSAASACRG